MGYMEKVACIFTCAYMGALRNGKITIKIDTPTSNNKFSLSEKNNVRNLKYEPVESSYILQGLSLGTMHF